MNKKINEILNKKMDRKDFLRHLGIGALMIGGVGALLKAFGVIDSPEQSQHAARPNGYGDMPYGGRKV